MLENPRFGRMITAMVSPFDIDMKLDLARAQELADRLVRGGNDALVINGTTGECPTIFYPQKIELFKAVLDAVDGRIPIIANVGDNCTDDSVDFARQVAKLGVDGFMAVVPYYNKPPQEGLYRHFGSIASAVDVPIVLYNIPGRCVINMTAETTLRLANDFDNIVAIKEASGKLDQIEEIIASAPAGFAVYSGDDSATYDIMRLGGDGVISTLGNVAPGRMRELVYALAEGRMDDALDLHEKLLPIMNGLFETSNPILVKAALDLVGFPVGGVRLPLVDATPAQRERLAGIMREVGIL